MTTDANEPSYYEIALTNRQVLVAFVLILGSVFGAFLCGVWVGKGSGGLLARELDAAGGDAAAQADPLADLESFRFFSDTEPKAGEEQLRKPDLSRLLEEPRADTTLAEDVGAAAEPAPAPASSAPPPPAAAPPPPAAAPRPAPPESPAVGEGFIVQVFTSHDHEQAGKIRSQLEKAGFETFIAPIEKDGETLFRVRIGPFAERAQAERAERKVKARFKLDTWVTAAGN